MKDRGPWRLWSTLLLLIAGNLCIPSVHSQSYEGARGDAGDSNPSNLGFSGVVTRHDGYVKGETPTIPQTSFSCSAQPYNPGLYADVETQCQVYHVCFEDRQESFLCGPGTNFNQRILACDFWYNFNCQDSPKFYVANADIGKVPDKLPETVYRPTPGQVSRTPQQPQPQPQHPRPQPQPQQPRPQPQPQHPRPQPQPQHPRPQPQPQQPRPQPQPQHPRPQPQPQHPRPQPQPQHPRPQPQPQQPRPQPQPQQPHPQPQPQRPPYPDFPQQPPQPPSTGSFPDRVRIPSPAPRPFQPQEPIQPQQPFEPQLPREPSHPRQPSFPQQPVQPQQPSFPSPPPFRPAPRPEPPVFQPQPRPEPPRESFKPQHPTSVSVGTGHQGSGRPYQPPTQQEEDGYQFDGHKPPKRVALPPTRPDHRQPVFPPVVSPPRVSRPPLTPPFGRQPEVSRPRIPVIDNRSEFHPDADIKGNAGYRPPQQPREPQPSRPHESGYPSYPVSQRPVAQRPVEKPNRPVYQPPTIQQEHVDTELIPPPKEPSRPSTSYVPPPPPPRDDVFKPQKPVYVPPPPPPRDDVFKPQKPVYVPPPVVQKPEDTDYFQPPVSPSVVRPQQKPVSRPPPVASGGSGRPQRPKPVFPPASDHPNSNIKGGPGYQQPPPQIPRFEPTRSSRPSSPQGSYQPRPVSTTAVKTTSVKKPSVSGQGAYKPEQGRVKKPSEPAGSVYQPPIQVIDHPQSEFKGERYQPPIRQEPQRVQSPSTPVSGIKRPQENVGRQPQRPRAPIVVSRPQPPSLPTTSVKKVTAVDNQIYEKPQPPAPARVKQPSTPQIQAVSRPSQPRFPVHDHPNANVKGGYNQRPIQQVSRPSGPPSSPSTSYEQKTTSTHQGRGSGSGRPSPPHGDIGFVHPPAYDPSRSSPPSSIKTVSKVPQGISAVKDTSRYERPLSGSQHSVLINKDSKPEYEAGSSYTRGPEVYPKPEFGKPNTPFQPVSTPSRQAVKQGSPSQNTITRTQNKPASRGPSLTVGSGSGASDVRPSYPFDQIPGHQPPHQRQVFPHRENPDHPNESLKGSAAYRPPPPAGFQAAASEVQEQHIDPEPSSDSKLGDTGSE